MSETQSTCITEDECQDLCDALAFFIAAIREGKLWVRMESGKLGGEDYLKRLEKIREKFVTMPVEKEH